MKKLRKTAKIGGWKYQYQYREREKALTIEAFRKLSLGMTYGEVIGLVGKRNGELNYHGMHDSIYYEIGRDEYVALFFDACRKSQEYWTLRSCYLYDAKEKLEQIF